MMNERRLRGAVLHLTVLGHGAQKNIRVGKIYSKIPSALAVAKNGFA